MKISSYIYFTIVLFSSILYSCSESKSETGRKENYTLSPFFKEFEDSLKLHLQQEKIPAAAIAVVRDSSVVYIKGFEYSETDLNDSLSLTTVFRLGSLSKGFAAVLTGMLVEQGVLDWHDKVVKNVPNFALKDTAQTQRIEIRHILSHTSGLPYHAYTNLIEDGLSLDKIIPKLASLDLIGKEGEFYAYQNATFAIIEKVIESVTDSSYSTLLRHKIFKAIQMKNASVSYDGLIEAENLAKPHGYNSRQEDYVSLRNSKKYYNAVSAGGVNASISDMAQWMLLLLGNHPEIISDKTLDYIFKPIIKVNTWRYSRRWGIRRSFYALGWRVLKFRERNIAFHGGYVNGYRSEIAIDRKNKLGICVLFNSPHHYAGQIIPNFFNAYFNSDSTARKTLKN